AYTEGDEKSRPIRGTASEGAATNLGQVVYLARKGFAEAIISL
nr:hypothetical protein [Tanacetum cinerariifolium]